ncbi:hypothetical protein LOK49_Contig56G00006 [Camellia lanceoleosa]|nr:hypothetical protein LOK49_Contig56G00006 [Camellia lanceoleosa]
MSFQLEAPWELLHSEESHKFSIDIHHSVFYLGVPDALKFASSRIYIVTTRQEPTHGTDLSSVYTSEWLISSAPPRCG